MKRWAHVDQAAEQSDDCDGADEMVQRVSLMHCTSRVVTRLSRRTPGMTAIALAGTLLFRAAAGECATAETSPVQTSAGAQPAVCACPRPGEAGTPPGVVWHAPAAPDLPAIAHLLAPILWFSSDEPLLLREGPPVPQVHPSDGPSASAVVYYQVTDLVLRGSERVVGTGEQDTRFFDKVDHFRLKYFFYYDEDHGLRPHLHDLEAIVMAVHLDRTPDGCQRVRVARVEGLAHGLEWYSNILRVEHDVVFPVTVLVEEGKHASVPDRNGDGVYTPGYDTNARVNDAWGLRDVLGSSVLLGARYRASMSKPRHEAFRLLPPADVAMCGRRSPRPAHEAPHLGRYELRPASSVSGGLPAVPEGTRLSDMMRLHRFGPEWPPMQYESDLARVLTDPENAFRVVSAFNARLDTNLIGGSLQGPGFDLREVWLVPRLLLMGGWGVEVLITPSASRWVDWYVAGGYERGVTRLRAEPDSESDDVIGFASEAGVKFRLTLAGRTRWAALGYRFAGLRLGIRTHGFSRIGQPRFVVEVGAGAF